MQLAAGCPCDPLALPRLYIAIQLDPKGDATLSGQY